MSPFQVLPTNKYIDEDLNLLNPGPSYDSHLGSIILCLSVGLPATLLFGSITAKEMGYSIRAEIDWGSLTTMALISSFSADTFSWIPKLPKKSADLKQD